MQIAPPLSAQLKQQLVDVAAAPYALDRYRDYYWARGKLSGDPIFAALLQRQIFADNARILDLGCGRGLLAAWLLAAEKFAQTHAECAALAVPKALQFRGVDLLTQQVRRGNAALQAVYGERVSLRCDDIRTVAIDAADVITMLDVLHYISPVEQERLLDRIRAALGRGGLFVTRVGDAKAGWRFNFSQYVDRFVASILNRHLVQTYCRSLGEWRHELESRGFDVQVIPMSQGTFFANAMLICRVL